MFVSSESCTRKPLVKDLNSFLICQLCRGYLIDATTTDECIHLFCRSCIVSYIKCKRTCPLCGVSFNRLIRDKTYQTLVYKLIPGLYDNEVTRRIEFAKSNQRSKEGKGSTSIVNPIDEVVYSPRDPVMISLSYFDDSSSCTRENPCRYLECPADFTVCHLKKFIRNKYGLCDHYQVIISSENMTFSDNATLLEIAYSCAWNQETPLKLYYRLLKYSQSHVLHTDLVTIEEATKSCGSHHNRNTANETTVTCTNVSLECDRNINTIQYNVERCASSVLSNQETTRPTVKDPVQTENCFEFGTNGNENIEEVECSSPMKSSEVTDICKMMSYVKLKEKINGKGFSSVVINQNNCDTFNTNLLDVTVNKERQGVFENCECNEDNFVKPTAKNFLKETCNSSISSYTGTSDSSEGEALYEELISRTQLTLPQKGTFELICTNDNIVNATAVFDDDKSRHISDRTIYEIHIPKTLESTYNQDLSVCTVTERMEYSGEACDSSYENKTVLETIQDSDVPLSYTTRMCSVPTSGTDKGDSLVTSVGSTSSQSNNLKIMNLVRVNPEIKQNDCVLLDSVNRKELLPRIKSCKKNKECNDNAFDNVSVEGRIAEELVKECKEAKQPLVMPEQNESFVTNAVPEAPEQSTTERELKDLVITSVEKFVIAQLVEELVTKCSLEGLKIEHGVNEFMAQCTPSEGNIVCNCINSKCDSNLSCNKGSLFEVKVIDKDLVPECEQDVFSLCNENSDSAGDMQQSNLKACVGVVDHKVSDGSSSKDVVYVWPVVKREDSPGLIASAATEDPLDKEACDEKPDEQIMCAVSDQVVPVVLGAGVEDNMTSTDCKLLDLGIPQLEIVKKVDGKETSVCEKAALDVISCNNHKKYKQDSTKVNKMKSSELSITVNSDDGNLKHVGLVQICSKEEPICDLFPSQDAKLSVDNLEIISTKNKLNWLKKNSCFTTDLVAPLPKPQAVVPDLLQNLCDSRSMEPEAPVKIFSSRSTLDLEKDRPAGEEVVCDNEEVVCDNMSSNCSIATVSGQNMPKLHRWDEDSWNSAEKHNNSCQKHTSMETTIQEFIIPELTRENSYQSCIVRNNLQECSVAKCENNLGYEQKEESCEEVPGGKCILQPRIVLHRIKRGSSSSPPPRNIKVKLGNVSRQHEDAAVGSSVDETKNKKLFAAAKGKEIASKSEGKGTMRNIHHQEPCSKGKKIVSQRTSQHKIRPKSLINAHRFQCCYTTSAVEQVKRNETFRENTEQCKSIGQNKSLAAEQSQGCENLSMRKRKVVSIENNNPLDGKKGLKRLQHKCARPASGYADAGKESEGGIIKVGCNSEEKVVDKMCGVDRNQDSCPLRKGLGLRPGDKHDSGGGGPESEAPSCTMEAKDVRVVVERCDGKLKQHAASDSSVVENKNTTGGNEQFCAKLNLDVESKLPNFCVLLTRLSSAASITTKTSECSESKSLNTSLAASINNDSSALGCEMPQASMAKSSLVTFPSAGCSQQTNSKNSNSSKNLNNEVKRQITVFADEELSQDFEMNINIRCGK